jgi:hypothetical protein
MVIQIIYDEKLHVLFYWYFVILLIYYNVCHIVFWDYNCSFAIFFNNIYDNFHIQWHIVTKERSMECE